MVASSQNLASMAGAEILAAGGNAADAAIAVAAGLQVTQPCSTGLGGDCFVLYYNVGDKKVYGLNGSGKSAKSATLARMKKEGFEDRIPHWHAHTVTVPGAPAGWVDFHERFGKLSMSKVLEPAILLAEEGFPVSQYTSMWWQEGVINQVSRHKHGHELMIAGRGPHPGEIMKNPTLASSLKVLAEEGKDPFYKGKIAERIVAAVNEAGGEFCMEDLARHKSKWVEPIGLEYKGRTVWEIPPNGQGLAVLIALNVVKHMNLARRDSVTRHHQLIEAMRIGFADAASHICDPDFHKVPIKELLSVSYGKERATCIDLENVTIPKAGKFFDKKSEGTDTVYFCTADKDGNSASFINSNFIHFGTGIVPEKCGYSLQNRGHGFVLEKGHPNVIAPEKRPFHTIIPGMITEKSDEFHSSFGVMGGSMQAQGHLQVVISLLYDNNDPQGTLDAPRFQLMGNLYGGEVQLEQPLMGDISKGLLQRGHQIGYPWAEKDRFHFGLGQIIMSNRGGITDDSPNVWWGGSDSRGDGSAIGL